MTVEARFNEVLGKAQKGDPHANAQLLPMIYNQLRELARYMMDRERTGHTLQPTAVVNEACLRLIASGASMESESRLHYFRLASREMRRVLIDHARSRNRRKREGCHERVTLDQFTVVVEDNTIDLLSLDEALTRLTAIDPVKAEIIEMRFFGGMTNAEVAKVLNVTTRTVERKWEVARRRMSLLIDGMDEPSCGNIANE